MATELEEALGQLSLHTLLAAAIVASGEDGITLSEDDFVDSRLVTHELGMRWDQDAKTITLTLTPPVETEE